MYIVDKIAYADTAEKPLTVLSVRPLEGYKLWIRFSTGETRIFDFTPFLDTGAFKLLKNKTSFTGVYVDYGIPTWNSGTIDIAPEFLYQHGKHVDEDLPSSP